MRTAILVVRNLKPIEMNSDEIRTGLGTKFVKEVIENNDYEYCNRSKAEAGATLANVHAINFLNWIKKSSLKNSDLPTIVLLKMYNDQKGLS